MGGRVDKAEKVIKSSIGAGIVVLILAVLFFSSFYVVPKGSNGCVFSNLKGWDYVEKEQGWHFKVPFVESVNKMVFRTQTLGIFKGGKNQYGVLTPKDLNGINYNVDITIRYRMDTKQICEFIEQKGRSIEPLLLTALRADSTRGVFGKFPQEDVPENRIEIAQEVTKVLQQRLDQEKSGKLKDGFIVIEAVDIRNVEFAERIENAIITKQEAKQEAEKRDYYLQQAEKEREIKIVQADATRQAQILEAEGRGEAILIEATAKAEGTQLVNNAYQSMPAQYVEVKYAEAMKELAKEGNVVVMDFGRFQGGQNLGILDYNKLMGIPQIQQIRQGGSSND